MEQANDYKSERDTYMNIIRHSLAKFTWGQMDYFARRVQVECERTVNKNERDRFKFGVHEDRRTCGVYILQNANNIPNFELGILAGEMMKRIEDNEMFKIYSRENWKDEQ